MICYQPDHQNLCLKTLMVIKKLLIRPENPSFFCESMIHI